MVKTFVYIMIDLLGSRAKVDQNLLQEVQEAHR